LQAEIAKDETDPLVTVFLGPERQTMDEDGHPTGDKFIEQNTSNPALVRLSELPTALADPSLLMKSRHKAA
jgi:hypothetical protein